MKMIRKYAIYTGHTVINGERTDTFDCPNKKCGREVVEDYACCPWCGQKLKFQTAAERIKEKVGDSFSVGMHFPDPLDENPYKISKQSLEKLYDMFLEKEKQEPGMYYKRGKYDC